MKQEGKNIFSSRNFKYGTVSVVITITVIVFIILLNAVLTFLFNRYPLSIDLTKNRVFEISEETEAILASLDRDVVIYVMNTELNFISASPRDYFTQANEVIKKYAQHSSRVRVEYIDLIRNPDFASRFPGEEIKMNDVIVTSYSRHKVIFPDALFNIFNSEYGDYVASSRAEQAMTSALVHVTEDKEYFVSVIPGGGIQDIIPFLELLVLNNYRVLDVNLLTGDILPDTSVLILANPSRDLSLEELRKIDAFLNTDDGKVFFYIASIVQPALPNLEEFLGEWGIAVEPGMVFEANTGRLISPSPYIAVVDYAESEYSKNMLHRNLQPLFAQSRPLKVLYDEFRSRFTTELLRFSAASGIRPPDAHSDWTPSPAFITGNVSALLLTTQSRFNAAGNFARTHVLVSGSILALEESTLGNPYLANSAYFLDVLANLTGRDDFLFINDKIIGFTELNATYSQVIAMIIIFTAVLPLLVLGAGIAVWLKRRHK